MQISAISFDGDMTLWDFYKVMRHSLTHTLRELRWHVSTQRALDLTVEDMIAIRNRLAEEVRVAKPDRRIFQITAQRAGCPLAQLLHVGDSLEQDVAGGNAAGAHTVWLNREGLTNDTGIKADYEISSLTDLPAILEIP